MAKEDTVDYLIIGAGIMGLAMARELKSRFPNASILVLEKEKDVAAHASGRNSGVLHAGFYYTADSLKAKFCREGNAAMREYVAKNNLRINPCGKVVVAVHERDLPTLQELVHRGKANGVDLKLIDEKELSLIEPNAKTRQQAIHSPSTAIIDPVEICQTLRKELQAQNVRIATGKPFQQRIGDHAVKVSGEFINCGRVINCAGLYADRIARQYGFSKNYTILPFKGLYLRYSGSDKPVKTCVYQVPNLNNPFLGVHFSVNVSGEVKIGPTAIPAFWRENYQGMQGFRFDEMFSIAMLELKLFALDTGNFRTTAMAEMRKYRPQHMAEMAAQMVKHLDVGRFTEWGKPGIRAQLVDTRNNRLVQDFVVEGDKNSTHVLNAVSPAFTSSFPFAKWIVENYILKDAPVDKPKVVDTRTDW